MIKALRTKADDDKLKLINSDYALAGDDIARLGDELIVTIAGQPYWTLREFEIIANLNNNAEALVHAYQRYDLELFNYIQSTSR